MINPVSFPDLSTQVSLTWLEATAVAERPEGATGAVALPAWRGIVRFSTPPKSRSRIGIKPVTLRRGEQRVDVAEVGFVNAVVRLFILGRCGSRLKGERPRADPLLHQRFNGKSAGTRFLLVDRQNARLSGHLFHRCRGFL